MQCLRAESDNRCQSLPPVCSQHAIWTTHRAAFAACMLSHEVTMHERGPHSACHQVHNIKAAYLARGLPVQGFDSTCASGRQIQPRGTTPLGTGLQEAL